MRIPCPNCAAEYDVPDSRISARRMVRCSRCNNQWAFEQKADDPAPADGDEFGSASDLPPAPEISAADRLGTVSAQAPRNLPLLAAWIASCLLATGGIAAAVAWRADVVRAWPPSARILGSGAAAAQPAPTPAPGPPDRAAAPRPAPQPAPGPAPVTKAEK